MASHCRIHLTFLCLSNVSVVISHQHLLREVLGRADISTTRYFEAMLDINGDGTISSKEFLEAITEAVDVVNAVRIFYSIYCGFVSIALLNRLMSNCRIYCVDITYIALPARSLREKAWIRLTSSNGISPA